MVNMWRGQLNIRFNKIIVCKGADDSLVTKELSVLFLESNIIPGGEIM